MLALVSRPTGCLVGSSLRGTKHFLGWGVYQAALWNEITVFRSVSVIPTLFLSWCVYLRHLKKLINLVCFEFLRLWASWTTLLGSLAICHVYLDPKCSLYGFILLTSHLMLYFLLQRVVTLRIKINVGAFICPDLDFSCLSKALVRQELGHPLTHK